jgi:hypothetical protein
MADPGDQPATPRREPSFGIAIETAKKKAVSGDAFGASLATFDDLYQVDERKNPYAFASVSRCEPQMTDVTVSSTGRARRNGGSAQTNW